MKRTFQLLIVVIIVLAGYIVFDFVQSRADEKLFQEQLKNSIPGTVITDEAINRGIAIDFLKRNWPSFEGAAPGKIESPTEAVVKSQLKLNGIIIDPPNPATVFIEDTISKKSGWYIENERINEWTIVKITENEVTIRNDAGEIARLTIERSWGADITQGVVNIVKGAKDIINIATSPDSMAEIAKMIEPMLKKDVPIEQLRPQIQAIISNVPRKVIEEQLQKAGIDPSEIPADKDLTDYALKLLAIGRNEQVALTGAVVELSFSLQVNRNNSPMTPTNTFPTGKYRIYTCFPNKDALKGMTKTIIRWNNQTSGETVSTKLHQLDINASYNFIWLEQKDGWTSGTYEVELFRVNTAEKVASGTYRVE